MRGFGCFLLARGPARFDSGFDSKGGTLRVCRLCYFTVFSGFSITVPEVRYGDVGQQP
jgi:hypothetical protein